MIFPFGPENTKTPVSEYTDSIKFTKLKHCYRAKKPNCDHSEEQNVLFIILIQNFQFPKEWRSQKYSEKYGSIENHG